MVRPLLGLLVVSFLTGCAFTRVADDGSTVAYGLMFAKVIPAASNGQIVATSLEVKTVGIGIHLSPQQNSVTVGYGHVSGIVLQEDVVVSVDERGVVRGYRPDALLTTVKGSREP